ncbi:cysteine desulfurase [Bacteroidetes/Chlorobi group bacterium ChocPot_Mid]|jgi:cysteine desulfurase/selenocysteine lyase|nr:MAG: cysteine desulfurase [Bacteroidetes/Chlorobi group bacterium ChocPot_Mid]
MNNSFDVNKIRKDFPILEKKINGKPLVYFDNAATTQKPRQVIEKIQQYYTEMNSNIHRAVHTLSKTSTQEYYKVREIIKDFINAEYFEEIIFTRGTTESINMVAQTWGRANLKSGDEVIITEMEHHSNIVPWQMICEEKGAKLRIAPMTDNCELILEEYEKLLTEKTKIVSFTHISNTLGTVNPIKYMIDKAHSVGAKVLLDAAQSVQHKIIDVRALDCDFLAFSGHKIYGPTGIGVLYGKKSILEEMPPYQGGGDMILSVSFEKTEFNYLPFKYEAGTPNIAGTIGLGEALKYVQSIGLDTIDEYETKLLKHAAERLMEVEGLKILGNAKEKASVISFIFDNIHPNDLGSMIDLHGVAIRTGHHCTEPIMRKFNIPGTSRASFSFYNTIEEVDYFIESLKKVVKMLG